MTAVAIPYKLLLVIITAETIILLNITFCIREKSERKFLEQLKYLKSELTIIDAYK